MKRCSVPDCYEVRSSRGLCKYHYDRASRRGELVPVRVIRPDAPCGVVGCRNVHVARGLCRLHYDRWRKARKQREEAIGTR